MKNVAATPPIAAPAANTKAATTTCSSTNIGCEPRRSDALPCNAIIDCVSFVARARATTR
ncbi:hypothetical protein [Dokdonella fugitiva]|jgi:hypothetical protein|uniref:hypothetical protein n=1 Tax=Dokdonella fugitiva TaxID=328517 RepID=UPI001045FBE0|nr:hypothetical protein [Dokdonella fugitiva]MBA8883098.1 hypothetical protein [Dokdonella fugitiva]